MKSLKRRRKGEKVNTVRTGENAPIVVLDWERSVGRG